MATPEETNYGDDNADQPSKTQLEKSTKQLKQILEDTRLTLMNASVLSGIVVFYAGVCMLEFVGEHSPEAISNAIEKIKKKIFG